jgi:hypothetical protein
VDERQGPRANVEDSRRSSSLPRSSLDLLEKYRWDAQYLSAGHYLAAKRYYRYSVWLGVLTIAAASITSTSVFASLATEQSVAWRVTTGFLAAVGATFASLQTFLKLAERSDRHKLFGSRFTEIRDRADALLIRLNSASEQKPDALLDEAATVAASLTTAAAEAPDLQNRDYDQARSGFRNSN